MHCLPGVSSNLEDLWLDPCKCLNSASFEDKRS